MTRLYKHQWAKAEGEILINGKYSDGFLTWCKETEHLNNDEWARGFDRVKDEIKKNKEKGVDSWPPNYIEFVVMCMPATTSPDGYNSTAYLEFSDEKHPAYQPKQIESDEKKTATQTAHDKAMADMWK